MCREVRRLMEENRMLSSILTKANKTRSVYVCVTGISPATQADLAQRGLLERATSVLGSQFTQELLVID